MSFVTLPILSNFPTNISFFLADYSTHDYYTTSSETSETSTLEDKEVEEKAEDLTAPEIEEFLQQTPYVQQQFNIQQPQQSGSYYTGRVGLPTPVFNLDVRRKQPGPRFRNEMLLPKRFRGKKKTFLMRWTCRIFIVLQTFKYLVIRIT